MKNAILGLLVAALAVLIVIAGLRKLENSNRLEASERKAISPAMLITVEHDGHSFIVTTRGAYSTASAVMHHPSCRCQK